MGSLTARILAWLTPFLAAAIFVLGVRVGAHEALLGVTLQVPRVAASARMLPIEVIVFEDDRTVRERKPYMSVTAYASRCGKEQIITVETGVRGDGLLRIELDASCTDRELQLRIEAAEKNVIFQGTLRPFEAPAPTPSEKNPMLAIGNAPADAPLAVFSLTQSLPAEEASSLWVRSRVGAIATLHAEPEGGLDVGATTPSGCDEALWELRVTPRFHVTGMSLTATFKNGAKTATWFGAIPVAKGTAAITLAPSVKASRNVMVPFRFPGERDMAYVAVDGPTGRLWETRQKTTEPAQLPELSPGLYWVHIASEPIQAAERGQVSTRPFLVSPLDTCAATVDILGRAGNMDVAPTTALLEGLPQNTAARHRLGLTIAIFGLVLGLVIEILILLGVRAPVLDVDGVSLIQSRKYYIIAGILFSALVFSLLATMLWVKVSK